MRTGVGQVQGVREVCLPRVAWIEFCSASGWQACGAQHLVNSGGKSCFFLLDFLP